MVDRQPSEIYKRRQIHIRINELKRNCEQLRHTKNDLLVKLRELNEKADQLIAERDQVKSQVKTDLFGSKFRHPTYQTRELPREVPKFSSKLATDDLNDFTSKFSPPSSSHRGEEEIANPIKGRPSDAFKTKLSRCLDDVMQKAEQIAELSEQLSQTGTLHDNHRKQQKTH